MTKNLYLSHQLLIVASPYKEEYELCHLKYIELANLITMATQKMLLPQAVIQTKKHSNYR
jgi:hypothetical protein